jgi:hypothetical protein
MWARFSSHLRASWSLQCFYSNHELGGWVRVLSGSWTDGIDGITPYSNDICICISIAFLLHILISTAPSISNPSSPPQFPSQLRRLRHCPDLQPRSILLQHRLIMVLPELLSCVLARGPLQDLRPPGMLVHECYSNG